MIGPLVLKLGGELLETDEQRAQVAAAVASIATQRPLALVHGGGRSVDDAMTRQQLTPTKVEGLRVTDAEALDVVVSVLAGTINTHLVAALGAEGVRAVGLTGADARLGRATRQVAHRTTTGAVVDLGFVGDPESVDPTLIELLMVHGYVPVVASLGVEDTGDDHRAPVLLNVNADVMACRLASALGGADLIIAGTTAGVLDASGSVIDQLDLRGIASVIATGTASAGMIAKLSAARSALEEGVTRVRIVDGRALVGKTRVDHIAGTTLTAAVAATNSLG